MGTNNDDEVEIDLLDMLAYFFQKWKYLLAGLAFGVLLIGCPLIYRQHRQIQSKYADTTLGAIQEDMTKGEIETVNQLYNRYKTFRERIINNQYYMDHSILMKMDPNNISNYSVKYVFEADQRTAVDYFNAFSLNLDEYNEIAGILGNDADPRFAYEVIGIQCTAAADDKIIDADMPDKIIVNGDITYKYRGLVNINGVTTREYGSKTRRPYYSVLDKTKYKTAFKGLYIPKHWMVGVDRVVHKLINQ